MGEEDKIFGPLTFRQFLYLAMGSGIIYFAYNYLDRKEGIPIIVVSALVTFAVTFINNTPRVVIDENYIKIKRSHFKNTEEFKKWLNKITAQVQAQITIREIRNIPKDPELERILELLENANKSS